MPSLFFRDPQQEYPVIARGEGIHLIDEQGRRYIDGTSGAGNVTLGHGRERIADVLRQQGSELAYCFSAFFTNRPALELAERLAALAPPDLNHAYFVSGGSEAIETAIKLARQYHLLRGKQGKHQVISRWRSYHGASLAAMSATGLPSMRSPFEPLLADFPHIAPCYPYRCELGCEGVCHLACAQQLEQAILDAGADNVAAFVAEPVVVAGMAAVAPPPEYFAEIRRICDTHDVLFIADEVITGYGRTGRHFAMEHWDVDADIILFGKGASSGYAPLGGIVIHDRIVEAFLREQAFFAHIFTYVNNPMAARVGLEVLDIMAEEGTVTQARDTGAYALQQARGLLSRHSCVSEIRGSGLLLGIELVGPDGAVFAPEQHVGQKVAKMCLQRGLVVAGVTATAWGGGDDLRFYPPLIITPAEVDEALDIIDDALTHLEATG